jgi:hypothetical protein
MSSNYPPGCSSFEWGAPWNDEEKEFEFTIKVSGTLVTNGPLASSERDEIFDDLLAKEQKEMVWVLNKNFPYDFEIED